jgi:hypothetical protein
MQILSAPLDKLSKDTMQILSAPLDYLLKVD